MIQSRCLLVFFLLAVSFCFASRGAAASVVISEIMAENDGFLHDQDDESPDWIELHNISSFTVNLGGWHLTDTPTNLSKWTFPSTSLAPGGYLVLFASGKNRAQAGAELHTNFQLEKDGSFLALVRPDGMTVESGWSPGYPPQRSNRSFGIGRETLTTALVSTGATARYFVPPNGTLGTAWTGAGFNDFSWTAATTGLGYDSTSTNANQSVLMLDFNDDDSGELGAANTETGWSHFALNINSNSFNGITVALSVIGSGTLDDRDRSTPVDVPPNFTQDQIYDDFIFANGANIGDGMRIRLSGLAPNQDYRLTIWSYDSGSTGSRVSDWIENGSGVTNIVKTGYSFDGSVAPVKNGDSSFSAVLRSSAAGVLQIEGKRSGGGSPGVFVNALQLVADGLRPLIASDIGAAMSNQNASAYVRLPFNLSDPNSVQSLKLRVKYDDGFVAYINGQVVASRNAPAAPQWNSTATAEQPNSAAAIFEEFNLPNTPGLLQAGANVLAIHGLNLSANDPDFLILPELQAVAATDYPERYFAVPTPGADNELGYFGFVEDTRFSVDRGFYDVPFTVAITTATAGAQIRYTRDGSAPSLTNGIIYTNAILVTNTTFLRAAAFKAGLIPSQVDTHTYIFLDSVLRQSASQPGYPVTWQGSYPADYEMDPNLRNHPKYGPNLKNDMLALPTISIVTEFDGLWGPVNGIYNHATSIGEAWERAASVELINPDGTTAFAENAGVRMQGNASRDNARTPKHSFRLLFKSSYGPSRLSYNWFPNSGVQDFDDIILRAAGFVDAWPSRYSDTTLYTNPTTGETYRGARYRPETGTYLRDVFVKDSHRDMGWLAARSDWVHLYINGLYWGIYNPSERIDSAFMSRHIGGLESDWDVLVGDDSAFIAAVADGSKSDWTALMNQLSAGITSEAAYQAVAQQVDLDNLIDYFMLHFFVEAEDWPNHNWYAAHRRANSTNGLPATRWQFFTWDQEVSLDRNVRRDRTGVNNADSPAQIYAALKAWPEFRLRFADRVQKHLFNGGALTPSNNVARFAAAAAVITNAINGESARWGDAREFTIGSNPGTGQTFTRDEWWVPELQKLWTNFFQNLTADNIARFRNASLYPTVGAPSFGQFGGSIPTGYQLVLSHTNAGGTIFYTIDGTDPRTYGTGAVAPTSQAYGTPIEMNAPTLVRARVLYNGIWSAIVEATFFPPQDLSRLTLTEIMYNPQPEGITPADEFEFIELKNTGTNNLNLSGLTFTAGIQFAFTNGTVLPPGNFFVLVRNGAAFASRYPGVPYLGIFTGRLNNAGEALTLSHPLGARVFSVSYSPLAPWAAAADGWGFSLVQKNPAASQAPDRGDAWRASAAVGGSPGADDPVSSIPAIYINEVLTASISPETDRVELFNPNNFAVNVGGWFLSDDPGLPKKFRIADGTMISAGGYLVFTEAEFNPTPGLNNSFSLSAQGDEIYLFSGDSNTNLTGYSHGFSFGAADPGVTFARYVNSAGDEQFPAQLSNTIGGNNSGPRVGPVVINEIMYHPALGGDPFIEIKNITANPVPLYDPANPANTWRISGLNFTLPPNLVLEPNGLLLVVATNPAAFRAKYSVPASALIVGPYLGQLQLSGERLELRHPLPPATNGVFYVTVDEVRYNDRAPWPPAADGSGPSLQRRDSTLYGNDPSNWDAIGSSPGQANNNQDTDGDGLPDSWEMANNTNPYLADADEDPDNDGATNLQEYLAGTNPQLASSRLKVDAIAFQLNPGNPSEKWVTLQFQALPNRSYVIQYQNSLGGTNWGSLTNVAAAAQERTISAVDKQPSPGARFYRLLTPAP